MNVLPPGLAEYDLPPDVFRRLHGYQAREYSWCPPDRGPEDVPKCKRYDHIFASVRLNPTACWYLHDLRGQGVERPLRRRDGLRAVSGAADGTQAQSDSP
ncbi:hypothetical protein [Methanoculleus chikugoensis]|uniref:hypothetical protein n=1 Tax=Methanoculleus chikugoensis TaxID=118126 RepID=UPI000AE8012C|nr:hypothetical protein [Methanoculleus chikugoensis]